MPNKYLHIVSFDVPYPANYGGVIDVYYKLVALKKAGIDYKIYIYEGAQHGFNNDTSPGRYNKEAAELAWKRTVAFFKEKLQ